MSKVMSVAIDGCKITPAGAKRAFTVQRVGVFMVQGNDFAIAEWRDEKGNLQMAPVCSINFPMAPAAATAPEPPRLAPPPPKKAKPKD